MMINDEHDQHDDEHHDDHVMHDMHTNTMHHARYSTWCKGNTHAQTHKRIKMHKNKRNVTKMQKHAKREQTMAFKKTMAAKRDERKGGPTTVRDPLKWDPHHKTRQGTE